MALKESKFGSKGCEFRLSSRCREYRFASKESEFGLKERLFGLKENKFGLRENKFGLNGCKFAFTLGLILAAQRRWRLDPPSCAR